MLKEICQIVFQTQLDSNLRFAVPPVCIRHPNAHTTSFQRGGRYIDVKTTL